MKQTDVIIIGAGAAGMMCAIEAGKRKKSVRILEQANKPGRKILMSGGGRCNFTNYHVNPDCFISHNPHFCISALTQYTQWDFIAMVEHHRIKYHEKTLGQLFCNEKSSSITSMLLKECHENDVTINLKNIVNKITYQSQSGYCVHTNQGIFNAESLVIASGGLSIPSMGSSPFGYQIAEQFGLNVWPTRAGLVPLTLHEKEKNTIAHLSGISFDSLVSNQQINFREQTLCTHRGLSGPAILQLSSYWHPGETIQLDLLPDLNIHEFLTKLRKHHEKKHLKSVLQPLLPKRLTEALIPKKLLDKPCGNLTNIDISDIKQSMHNWTIKPNGTEGYRTAEVTLGGVDCNELSSKTMMSKKQPGLFFIGEVVDVTGWLGGYNFQWAWSSGFVAGQAL